MPLTLHRLPAKSAALAMLSILSCVLLFHFLVLIGVVPYAIVWGGRLENESQTRVFEAISVVVNLFIMTVVGMKAGYLRRVFSTKALDVSLWLLVVLFSLNTVGNLFATTTLETIVFTPLTFLSALLCYRLAAEER